MQTLDTLQNNPSPSQNQTTYSIVYFSIRIIKHSSVAAVHTYTSMILGPFEWATIGGAPTSTLSEATRTSRRSTSAWQRLQTNVSRRGRGDFLVLVFFLGGFFGGFLTFFAWIFSVSFFSFPFHGSFPNPRSLHHIPLRTKSQRMATGGPRVVVCWTCGCFLVVVGAPFVFVEWVLQWFTYFVVLHSLKSWTLKDFKSTSDSHRLVWSLGTRTT